MEITAQEITMFLKPFLPYLVKIGSTAATSAAEELGENSWQAAKQIWQKLTTRTKSKAVKDAAKKAAQDPTDRKAIIMLQSQIKKVMIENRELVEELASLMRNTKLSTTIHINQKAGNNSTQIANARNVKIKK